MQDKILVVMPYKHTASQGNELILSLTGWKKFCTFDYHFVVIGDYTEEQKQMFPEVEFIYCETIQTLKDQYTPHLDIQHKMEIIMNKYADKYDGFIRIADDQYAVNPFTLEDIITPHYIDYDCSKVRGVEQLTPNYWIFNKQLTIKMLKSKNLPIINYTIHYPYYYEFSKLKEIWDKFDMREQSYVLEDVYFNYFTHEQPVLINTVGFRAERRRDYQKEFLEALANPNIKFVNNTPNTWCKDLETKLQEIYNSK